jgi:hypothetical protein
VVTNYLTQFKGRIEVSREFRLFLKFLVENSIDPVTGSYLRRYKDIFRLKDLALTHIVFEVADYIVNNFKRKNCGSSSNSVIRWSFEALESRKIEAPRRLTRTES